MATRAAQVPLLAVSVLIATVAACSASPAASPQTSARPTPSSGASPSSGPSPVEIRPSPSPTTPMTTDIEGTIVFSRAGDLYAVGRPGEKQLTATDSLEQAPEWAPDGQSILFTSDTDGTTDLYLMKVGGGDPPKRLPNSPADESGGGGRPTERRLRLSSSRTRAAGPFG
jgi:hypothetical protein